MKKLMILLTMTMFFMACCDNGVAATPDTNIPQETPSSSSNTTPGIIPLANSSDSHTKTLDETCEEHLLKAVEYTNNGSHDKICPVYRNILNQMVLFGSLTAADYDYCVTLYNCK